MPESTHHLRDLTVEWVSLVDRAAVRDPSNPTEPQRLLLWKAESGADKNTTPKGGNVPTAEELSAALQKAETERDELAAKVEKLEKKLAKKPDKDDKADKAESINKDELPQPVREALEKAEAQAQAAEQRIAKAEEIAKTERDTRIEREFVAKAEAEFAHVAGSPGEFGKLLKSMSEKLTDEEFEAVQKQFRSAEEIARTSNLFKEAGVSGDPAPNAAGDAVVARITQKAEELRKADPSLSAYEAMDQARRLDPEGQASYLAANR